MDRVRVQVVSERLWFWIGLGFRWCPKPHGTGQEVFDFTGLTLTRSDRHEQTRPSKSPGFKGKRLGLGLGF